MYYDTKLERRQTDKHLARRGLDKPDIDLVGIGILDLVYDSHGIDTDLYTVTETGTEIKDGKAYVVYDKIPKTDTSGIRQIIKEKVHDQRDILLSAGVNFTFDGAVHTLQTRDAGELLAWDKTRTKAKALPTDALMKVRTEADKELFIPAGQLAKLLDYMEDYRWDVMEASWKIKDAIDQAASDADAFETYEGIETIWPDAGPIQL